MTSYLTQTLAQAHVAHLVDQAHQRRLRHEFRVARRQAKTAARAAVRAARKGAPTADVPRRTHRDPYLQYFIPSAR